MSDEYDVIACAYCNKDADVPKDWDSFQCPYCSQINQLTVVYEAPILQIRKNGREPLVPNKSVLVTWCSRHRNEEHPKGKPTEHLWTGHRLICLVCWPSKRKVLEESK